MSENSSGTILVIRTFDTKNDEFFNLSDCIQKQNAQVTLENTYYKAKKTLLEIFGKLGSLKWVLYT